MLRVIPLGGLGEIGLNAMVFECRGEQLLVDCGLMFPTEAMPGVELVLPDLTYVRNARERLKGVVLTHGHEDHIGAVPSLLRDVPVPVYGTRLTLGLLRHRLDELGLTADLREISPREPFAVGETFTVEAVRVCHSIPDGVGLVIRTPEGTLVHTGDFKLDAAPIDGRLTDLERLGEVGEEGVLCLLSDSTNSELDAPSGEERTVAETFERLFTQASGRVVVSMFASNLNRVQHVLELAARTGRKVAPLGRSMLRNIELARNLGYLSVPEGVLISADQVASFPAHRVVILATGSQAEPRSGLVQLIADESKQLSLSRGDLVILSARTIPGNERAVTELIDLLHARGAKVAYSRIEPGVHVSGHAGRQEQRRMLDAVRPRHFVPIHGELRHLHQHLEVARESGVGAEKLLLARDGDVVGFDQGRGALVGRVPHGRIFRDRYGGGTVLPATLEDRALLSETGVVIAVVVLEAESQRLLSGPSLFGRGLSEEETALLSRAAAESQALFLELSPTLRVDDALVKEELARAVRRVFKQHLQKRPTVMPVLVRL